MPAKDALFIAGTIKKCAMVSCMIEHHGSGPGPLRYMYIPFLLQCMLADKYKYILDKLKLVFVNGNGLVRAIIISSRVTEFCE